MSDSHGPQAKAYWKEYIRLVLSLLTIWFVAYEGIGILFVDALDEFRFYGFKFGFWMAQQGSIFCFVIFFYLYL